LQQGAPQLKTARDCAFLLGAALGLVYFLLRGGLSGCVLAGIMVERELPRSCRLVTAVSRFWGIRPGAPFQ
jgi:hypothetical protein